MRVAPVALVLSSVWLGCGGGSSAQPAIPTPPATDDEAVGELRGQPVDCGYGFKVLYLVPDDPLQTEARVEGDRATTLLDAGDPATAAQRFLGCAELLRRGPADDGRIQQNAEVCYYNAAYAFATAGTWTRDGRAALEAAAAADPARAGYIRDELLAAPPVDCVVPVHATP